MPRRTGHATRRATAWRGLGLGVLLAGVLAAGEACGVPGSSRAQTISGRDVPFGLMEPAEMTTTTTLVFAEGGLATPSSIVETVHLYFPEDGRFVAVARTLPAPVTLDALVAALSSGPQPADQAGNVRSVIGEGDVDEITSRGGVAMAELGAKFPELPPAEQRLAVAQLVLTLTDRPGIGQVRFALNQQPADVPRADGSLDRGSLSRDDYSSLLR